MGKPCFFFFDFLLLLIPLVVLARWKRFLVQGYPFEGVVKSVHRLEGPPSSGSPKYVLILPYYRNPYKYIYIEQFIAISTPQRSQNCLKSGLEFERKLQYTIMYTVYIEILIYMYVQHVYTLYNLIIYIYIIYILNFRIRYKCSQYI